MIDARKDIIFRDEHYQEKFRIKDGDSIKVTVAYDVLIFSIKAEKGDGDMQNK